MSLKEKQLYGTVDKVQTGIDRLRQFEPKDEPYYGAFSGGKDSVTAKRLAVMAGVKIEWHYNVTTIDPPELVYFIREHHPDVIWDRPEEPLLVKMAKKGYPSRLGRWCCELYKEHGGDGRFVVTGVRAAESAKRAGRRLVETCFRSNTGKRYLNVIVDWSDADVWEFIHDQMIPYCSLYDEGFERLGCIMCPMARPDKRMREHNRWPGYAKQFRKAFRCLYSNRVTAGNHSVDKWADGDAMFDWWLSGDYFTKQDPDQGVLFE